MNLYQQLTILMHCNFTIIFNYHRHHPDLYKFCFKIEILQVKILYQIVTLTS